MNYNKIIQLGRLTRDPELKYTAENEPFCKFGLAINPSNGSKGSTKPLFLEVMVWKKSAEACSEHLSKGQTVLVEGSLQCREWTDSENVKRSILQIFAQRVEFGPKSKAQASQTNPGTKDGPPELDEGGVPF